MSPRLEALLEVVKDHPHDPFPHYGLALEYKSLGRRDEAARAFRDLLKNHPNYVPGYLQAGMMFVELGLPDEARLALEKGVQVATQAGDGHAKSELLAALESLR